MREFIRSIIDFIQYAFLLALIVFLIVYFIVGNRLYIFAGLLQILVPVSYFGAVMLLCIKINGEKIEKFQKEDNLGDVIAYFTHSDKIKDLVVITILPVIILLIAFFWKPFNTVDAFQAAAGMALMLVWNFIIFSKKEDGTGAIYMTNFDRIKDEIMIFFLPFLIISISAIAKNTNIIDSVQAFVAFLLFYLWRKILLLGAKKI